MYTSSSTMLPMSCPEPWYPTSPLRKSLHMFGLVIKTVCLGTLLEPTAMTEGGSTVDASLSCIFCRIIRGEASCYKVYEDEHAFAFLDINPLSHFHTLLIPKRHYERHASFDDQTAAALGVALGRVSRAVTQASGDQDYNIVLNNGASAGQEVWHAHYHIVPRTAGDGLRFRWKAGKLLPKPQIESFLSKVQEALGTPSAGRTSTADGTAT